MENFRVETEKIISVKNGNNAYEITPISGEVNGDRAEGFRIERITETERSYINLFTDVFLDSGTTIAYENRELHRKKLFFADRDPIDYDRGEVIENLLVISTTFRDVVYTIPTDLRFLEFLFLTYEILTRYPELKFIGI